MGNRPSTTETGVRSKIRLCEICGGQSDTGTCFSPSNCVFPFQHNSTNAPYLPPSVCCAYQKDKRRTLETLQKAVPFGKSGALCSKVQYFHLFRDSEVQSIVLLNLPSPFYRLHVSKPIPVAARFEAWVCGRSLAGILSSSSAWGLDVCLL